MPEPLPPNKINDALADLEHWSYEGNQLKAAFKLTDFRAAISFIVRMAFYAEEMNHHPEIENVYDTVSITLTTHDAGNRVTQKDLDLAKKINEFAWV